MTSGADTSDQLGELDQVARAAIGPRRVGGIYRNGYLGCEYRVEEVLTGEAARAVIPFSDFALVEADLTGPQAGRWRVHCTAWDPRRDEIVEMPERPSPPGGHRSGGVAATGRSPVAARQRSRPPGIPESVSDVESDSPLAVEVAIGADLEERGRAWARPSALPGRAPGPGLVSAGAGGRPVV